MKAFFDSFLNLLKKVDNFFAAVEKAVLIGVLSFVIGLSFFQVILRTSTSIPGYIHIKVILQQFQTTL